jgi:hypothetical protein
LVLFLPMTWWFTRRLRREFREAGGRLCTHCGYNVGSLCPEGICPECGSRFDVAIDAQTWSKAGFKA